MGCSSSAAVSKEELKNTAPGDTAPAPQEKSTDTSETKRLLGADTPKALPPSLPPSTSGLWSVQTFHGMYLSAEGGAAKADALEAKEAALITFATKGEGRVALKGSNGKYLSADASGALTWDSEDAGAAQTFDLCEAGEGKLALKSLNGNYLSADKVTRDGKDVFALVANKQEVKEWETFRVAPSAVQEEAPVEAKKPLSLDEAAAAFSAATPDNRKETVAGLSETNKQKVVAAINAVEPNLVKIPELNPANTFEDGTFHVFEEQGDAADNVQKPCCRCGAP